MTDDQVAREVHVMAQADAVALGPERRALCEHVRLERHLARGPVPPAGELGHDVGAALVPAPAAPGQRRVQLRVAAVSGRERLDLAVLDGPAQGVEHGAHWFSSAAIAAVARRLRDAALAHERRDQLGGRDVERRVAHRDVGQRDELAAGRGGPRRRRAPRSRSSSPVGSAGSTDDVGPATTNGMPAARAASACAYVPTLLATSPLAATRSQPTITASTSPRRIRPAAAPSTASVTGMPSRAAPRRSAARPAAAGASRTRGPRRRRAPQARG